jgi:hypothetical protein
MSLLEGIFWRLIRQAKNEWNYEQVDWKSSFFMLAKLHQKTYQISRRNRNFCDTCKKPQIIELTKKKQKLKKLAIHDSLVLVLNWKGIQEGRQLFYYLQLRFQFAFA